MPTNVDREHLHLKIVQEISDFVNKSTGLDTILKGVVSKISESLHFGIVSVYITDAGTRNLRLAASTGLKDKFKKPVTLSEGEGVTGMVFKTMRPFVSMNVSSHPQYKSIADIQGEAQHDCYLGVPIVLNNRCVGVLVGQTSERRHITPAEQTLFEIISSRLAGLLEVADTLDRLHTQSIVEHTTRTYQGTGASPGVTVGKVFLVRGLFGRTGFMAAPPDSSPTEEKKRLLEAFSRVQRDMKDLISVLNKDRLLSKDEMEIFEAHQMLLSSESPDSVRGVLLSRIDEGKVSAETAVVQGIESIAARFEHHSDRYVREKAQDFRDIGEKLLHELLGLQGSPEVPEETDAPIVLVAQEIGPSFVSMLGKNRVSGVITERGGETSHAVIIAKSLGIPVVIGIDNICELVASGDKVIIDGRTGFVFVNPDEALIGEYESSGKRIEEIRHLFETDEFTAHGGIRASITANIGFPDDVDIALRHGVEDVGLFRTEFAFARFEKPPGVDEQTTIYGDISKRFSGRVTVRTLDMGADKMLPYFNIPEEENPLLGLRAIRFSMEYLDLFREQIKSILLAATDGARLRILLPMVSNIWEVETARQIMDDIAAEVDLDIPPLGVMLEVPALVPLIDEYSEIVDFISVGTNDLVQYLLAVDRNSTAVGHLYTSFHPAVLRVLDTIRKSAGKNRTEVSICGELAGSPKGALLIFALGYRNLSVSPYRIPVVKFISNRISRAGLLSFKKHLMEQKSESDIERLLADRLEEINPALVELG